MLQLNFTSISELLPGPKWQKLFNTHWPAYKTWFQSKGAFNQPGLKICEQNMERYMPEMMPTYHTLCKLAGNDKEAARFLTGYQPPAYISGCSQVVWQQTPMLVRNYDYHPHLSEGTLLHSAWNGKKVIATGDCLSGVVDGMNEDGLVVSLTFGGRKVVGQGFGIPFILRYVLEFCSDLEQAVEALCRIPSHMAYNVMVLNKAGKYKMVQLSPDNAPVVTDSPVSTNHQGRIDWPEHAAFSKTVERENFLLKSLEQKEQNEQNIANSFLQPPLYNRRYNDGFGTVYTAVYKPGEGVIELLWPEKSLKQSFKKFEENIITISYTETAPATAPIPVYNEPALAGRSYERPSDTPVREKNYWAEYGQSWASVDSSGISRQVAKTIVESMGFAGNAETSRLIEQLVTGEAHRGQIPWEMIADVWANLGKYYSSEN